MKNITEIKITIYTGWQHNNKLEETRQKIEKATHYIDSIVTLITLAKAGLDVYPDSTNDVLESVENASDLIWGLTASIRESVTIYVVFEDEKEYGKFEVIK